MEPKIEIPNDAIFLALAHVKLAGLCEKLLAENDALRRMIAEMEARQKVRKVKGAEDAKATA